MTEQDRKTPPNIDGVTINEHHMGQIVDNIPSDRGSFVLQVMSLGDVWMTLKNSVEFNIIPLDGIRFRSFSGGGDFTMIPEELSVLPRAFADHRGQIPPNYKGIAFGQSLDDRIPWYLLDEVKTSKKPREARISIKNIRCDDEGERSLMNIDVAQNGNVTLTMQETRLDRIRRGQMIFKTAKNGGKFPIMAFAFTRIAERIVKAKNKLSKTI